MLKISPMRIILTIFIVNAAGFLLRYFGLDTYIIIIGFRFHLSFTLPIFILYPGNFFHSLKNNFVSPEYKAKFQPVLIFLISAGLTGLILFLTNKIDLGDPDYFYEFGLSSIFDYPIYLIWNFPQFVLLFMFLHIASEGRNKLWAVFFMIFFLFVYEIVPVEKVPELNKINYVPLLELLFASISGALFFKYFRNIYWFCFVFFTTFWSSLLAFGTKSVILINLLFAAQYTEWEGFFKVDKIYYPYLLSGQFLMLMLLILVFIPLGKTKTPSNNLLSHNHGGWK